MRRQCAIVGNMTNYLIAHCPTFECYTRVPIWELDTAQTPRWLQAGAYVVVVCPRCGKEFRELASALELSPSTTPAEKIQP